MSKHPWRMVTGAAVGFLLGVMLGPPISRTSMGVPVMLSVVGILIGLAVDLYVSRRLRR